MKINQRTLFILPFVVLSGFSLLVFFLLELILTTWFLERNEAELSRMIDVTYESIVRIQAENDDMQLIVDNIGMAVGNYRVNIFNHQGKMLGDSLYEEHNVVKNIKPLTAEAVLQQPEIQAALTNGIGQSTRKSLALKSTMFYLAKRFEHNNRELIIRIGMNTDDYDQAVSRLRSFLLIMALSGFTLIGLLIYGFSRLLKRSISKEQALLEKRVQERTQTIQLLQRLANMLAACKYIDEVQGVVEDLIPRLIGDLPCSIALVNASRNLVESKIHWGKKWPGIDVYSPDECWALRKGKFHFSRDVLSSQRCEHMAKTDDVTLCIPLLAHGQAIGVFHLVVGDNFSKELENVAFTLAEHLGLAIANLILQDTLRNQATRDPLTGLYNRRHMEQTIELELNRALRHDKSCALLMLDLDHFKRFNDNFGHDAGDYVLKFIAQLLISTVRKEDIVCRIGGEEIAIILPEVDIHQAEKCAEKICYTIAEQDLNYHNLSLGRITASIGIGVYPEHAKSVKELIKAADVALYQAKNKGRNCYVRCETLLSVVTSIDPTNKSTTTN